MVHGSITDTLTRGLAALGPVILLTGFLAVGAWPGHVRADVFMIENVVVDATAESAAAARERAIAEGQKAALAQLFGRLVPDAARASLPHPSPAELGDMVRDFAVDGEKTSSVRYLANLSVRFRPDDIRALLRAQNISFAETMSKPIVILPVYKAGGGLQLWEDANPWRQAWLAQRRDGLVPFVVPLGDLEDLVAIDAKRAQAGDREGLSALAYRYGAGGVIVAVAELVQQSGAPMLQVTTVKFAASSGDDVRTMVRTVTAEGAGNTDELWTRAASAMAETIEEDWKRTNLIHFDGERSLVATVYLDALPDLLEIRKRLSRASFLRSYNVLYMARDAAQFRLNFFGDERQLVIALAQSDLALELEATDWILRRSGAPRRASHLDRSQ